MTEQNENHAMKMDPMGFVDWCGRNYTSTAAAFGDLMDNANDATAHEVR